MRLQGDGATWGQAARRQDRQDLIDPGEGDASLVRDHVPDLATFRRRHPTVGRQDRAAPRRGQVEAVVDEEAPGDVGGVGQVDVILEDGVGRVVPLADPLHRLQRVVDVDHGPPPLPAGGQHGLRVEGPSRRRFRPRLAGVGRLGGDQDHPGAMGPGLGDTSLHVVDEPGQPPAARPGVIAAVVEDDHRRSELVEPSFEVLQAGGEGPSAGGEPPELGAPGPGGGCGAGTRRCGSRRRSWSRNCRPMRSDRPRVMKPLARAGRGRRVGGGRKGPDADGQTEGEEESSSQSSRPAQEEDCGSGWGPAPGGRADDRRDGGSGHRATSARGQGRIGGPHERGPTSHPASMSPRRRAAPRGPRDHQPGSAP